MDRKIRVMILTMVLTVLLFGGTRLMAQDLSNKPSETQTTPDEEKSKEEGSLAKTNENEEGSEIADNAAKDTTEDNNVAVLPKGSDNSDPNKNATENNNENLVKEAPKTKAEGAKTLGEEAKTEEQVKAKEALEANKAKEEGKGKEDGAKANPQKAPLAEPNKEEQGAPEKKTEEKKNDSDKPQIDTKTDKDLNDLQAKINAEQDPKKKAELQKEYNEKYLEKVEAAGADKTDPNIQERLTKDEDIKKYNIIKAKQEELKQKKEALEKKIAEGKASKEDIEAFKNSIEEYNKLLGEFKPPRALTAEEKSIKDDFVKKPYINIDNSSSSENGIELYQKYQACKEALINALDPTNNGLSQDDINKLSQKGIKVNNLQELKNKFDELNNEVLKRINDPKVKDEDKIVPKFTNENGSPKIDIFPYDFTGSIDLGKNLNEKGKDDYYLPDGTPLKLFVQVGRDNPEKDKEATEITFTLTPSKIGSKIGNPAGADASLDTQVIVLNGEPIELKNDGNGNYTFTTKQAFGVGQFKIDMSSMYGELHEGFKLKMVAKGSGKETTVEKNFLITKKGYDENPETGNIGNTDKEKPQKEDPGKIEDGKVSDYTDKVFDIFALLKKSNGYIDEVLVNSVNGKALPLSHVKITMNIPKNSDGKFAEYIHKSGLKYEKQEDGKYVLELERKEFGDNLVEDNGNFYLKTESGNILLQKAEDIENAVLEGKEGKTYVDKDGKVHEGVKTVEAKDGKANDADETEYRLIGDQLSKKVVDQDGNVSYTDVINFNGKKIATQGNTTYELRGDTLLIYTDTKDVYDGHVSNKKDPEDKNKFKADKLVTPTNEGKQVTVTEGSNPESYGGTIVEEGIFDKTTKKYVGKSGSTLEGVPGDQVIDSNGKKSDVTKPTDSSKIKEEKDGDKVLYKYFQDDDGNVYHIVTNAVFNGEYIVDGLEYKKDTVLLDKFGNQMKDITVKKDVDGNYIFTKKLADKNGKAQNPLEAKTTEKSENRTIKVNETEKQIFVNDKNYIVDNSDKKYEAIIGKYYYDKDNKKFVSLEDKKDKIIDDKYYVGLVKAKLKKKTIETYMDRNIEKDVPTDAKRYFGSDKVNDYYKADEKYYAKQPIGEGEDAKTIFVSGDEVLTTESITKILQIFKDGSKKIVDAKDIFEEVNKAKFQLRFPGYLTGKNIVYNLKTEIAADYIRYNPSKKESEEVSIYKDEKGNHKKARESSKTIDKYFYFDNKVKKGFGFFKERPKDLEKVLDYSFFNIFYRDGSDRQRDEYVKTLLENEKDNKYTDDAIKKAKEAVKAEKDTEKAKEKSDALAKLEEERDFLNLLKAELKKFDANAKFDIDDEGNLKIVYTKDGKTVEVDRTLLWKVGFNSDGKLFPEDTDSEITIEDHNMDNRLVYDEIIINDKKDNWEKAKKEWEAKPENAGKKFAGTDEYFFLDQLKRIFLGVNPYYVDEAFVPAGKEFVITREDIEGALKKEDNFEGTITKDNGTSYKVTYDPKTAQIKIKVLNAFYNNKNLGQDAKNHFESPVQKAYQKRLDKVKGEVDGLNTNDLTQFKTGFTKILADTYTETTDCYKTLKHKFEKMMQNVEKLTDKAKEIENIKTKMLAEMAKQKLEYLDKERKGEYKFDDMGFNALRFELAAGQSIGGPIDDAKKKYIGISSVLVPEIDIPFTDEFGDILTNRDMYLKQAIEEIKNDKKFNNVKDETIDLEKWDESEDLFKKVMNEAYARVNKKEISEKIKTLVTVNETKPGEKPKVGVEKYTVKNGSDFKYEDFAIGQGKDRKSLKDKSDNPVNPLYIGDGEDKDIKTIDKNIDALMEKYKYSKEKMEEFKKSEEYKRLTNPMISIGAYYMHAKGYDRATFANSANYKLNKVHQGPGVFGDESHWKNKVCYPGPIGKCLEEVGGDKFPDEDGASVKDQFKDEKNDKFTITYPSTGYTPDGEYPKFTKTGTENIDLSGHESTAEVNYKVELIVDKVKSDQKISAGATKPVDDKTDEDSKNYNERGYFVYKNSLIIDFLPEIFKFKTGTIMRLDIDEKALKANGANTYDEFDFEKFKKDARPIYVENVYEYLETLDKTKAQYKALETAIKDAEEKGKLDRNGNKHAVLAWLPNFEAPHGSTDPQFSLVLEKLEVDKKLFKEYEENKGKGEIFTNHAVFDIFYAKVPTTITDKPGGTVDKTMRIYDKDGKIVNEKTAKEWFRGYVELKFGDQYDYKIKFKYNKAGYEDINSSRRDVDAFIVDMFGKKDFNHGFRPVLRELPDFKGKYEGYIAEYALNNKDADKFYTEEEIEKMLADKEITLGNIIGVKIKHKAGFEIGGDVEFILPMMIPNLDAKVEDGKVYYIGQDGKRVDLGNADKYFKLDKLKSSKEKDDMFATNTVDGSNTVTVYLEKERFIRVFKEFLAANGEKLKNLDNLEAKFDVYQIIEENGKKTRVKLDKQLIVNKDNNFTDMLDHLPIFKKITTIDKDGKVTVNEIKYEYELEEAQMPGFESKVWKIEDNDGLGFVWQATNTEKPEYPGDHPHDNPKNVKVKITVNKVWRVLKGGETPSIQVELYANGEATGKIITLGADGSWSASFEDLPSKDANGKEIIYTVREIGESNELTKIDDRTFEVIYTGNLKDGFTIINKEIPPDDEKPKDKKEPKKHKPNDEEGRDRTPKKNRIPKTGVNEDLGAIYFAFVLLLGLVFIKKRYLVK